MTRVRVRWLKIVMVLIVGVMLVGPVLNTSQAQIGGTLGYGSSVFGTISATVPSLTYSFTGNAGDLVTVEVMGLTGGLDPAASLIAPDGLMLPTPTDDRYVNGTSDVRFSLFLPQAGSYSLLVSGANGTVGDFLLRLQGRPPVDSTLLIPGMPVAVDIVPGAAPQYFAFDALDCPTTLTITNLSPGQPYTFPFVARVRNESGATIALLRGGETLEDRVTVTPLSGRYEIDVLSDDPLLGGMLTLLVSCGVDAPGCGGDGSATGAAGDAMTDASSGGDASGGLPMVCPVCPTCPEPGDVPEGDPCEDTDFTAALIDPVLRTGTASWAAVEGADTYTILVYILYPDGEFLHGSIAFSEASGWIFDFGYLPDEFIGLHFVLEVRQGGEIICLDEAFVWFDDPAQQEACENWWFEIHNNTGTSIDLVWPVYPGAEGYAVTVRDGATGDVVWGALVDGALTGITVYLDPGAYWVAVSPWNVTEGSYCGMETAVNLEGDGPVSWGVCDVYLQAPREGMANGLQTFFWTPVDGATSYRVRIYNESGVLVAEGTIAAPATSLTLDVSTASIGEGLSFVVAIEAYRDGEFWCVDTVTQFRSAPDPGQSQAQPNQDNGGGVVCGNGICQPGENANTCPADCGCDNDQSCEPLRGENANNCPNDCGP